MVSSAPKLLEVTSLNYSYRTGLPTLQGNTFSLTEGINLGIVGESGSGKSTLLKLLLGLLKPDSGEIRFDGALLSLESKSLLRNFRSQLQVVFQDPYSSLDPRQNIFNIIAEPLISLGLHKGQGFDRRARSRWITEAVHQALDSVAIPASSVKRYPGEFSGGQRQRIAIARAIVCKPRLLLADEPVSALDLTTRVQIIDLLKSLAEINKMTIVTVSHDLSVVASLCQETIVLEKGFIVEQGSTSQVLGKPSHPYTEKLIASLPRLPSL